MTAGFEIYRRDMLTVEREILRSHANFLGNDHMVLTAKRHCHLPHQFHQIRLVDNRGISTAIMEIAVCSHGCGNTMNCNHPVVQRMIIECLRYWVTSFRVDGFRFDLMGLLTVELMNRIRRELDETFGEGEKLLYGEPWRATDSPMEEGTNAALKSNVQMLDQGIAMFSDDTRDVIKGHVFYEEIPGFVNVLPLKVTLRLAIMVSSFSYLSVLIFIQNRCPFFFCHELFVNIFSKACQECSS